MFHCQMHSMEYLGSISYNRSCERFSLPANHHIIYQQKRLCRCVKTAGNTFLQYNNVCVDIAAIGIFMVGLHRNLEKDGTERTGKQTVKFYLDFKKNLPKEVTIWKKT